MRLLRSKKNEAPAFFENPDNPNITYLIFLPLEKCIIPILAPYDIDVQHCRHLLVRVEDYLLLIRFILL